MQHSFRISSLNTQRTNSPPVCVLHVKLMVFKLTINYMHQRHEKPTAVELAKELPNFQGTPRFTVVFARACM